MARLSITEAWNETAAFVRDEARLLFPIAFLLVALPGGVLQLFMPPPPAPGAPPPLGAWLLIMPLSVVAAMIGTIALSYLALRPGASVGEALLVGARRFIFLLAATLLVALAAILAAIPLFALGALAFTGGATPEALAGFSLLVLLVVLLGMLALWVRLMLMTPVTAVEDAGPIGIIRRSWELTRGHFWRLLGFVLLVFVAALIVMAAVSAVAGILVMLLLGPPEPLTLSAILVVLVGSLMQALFSMIFATLIARIYVQLAGFASPDVFA